MDDKIKGLNGDVVDLLNGLPTTETQPAFSGLPPHDNAAIGARFDKPALQAVDLNKYKGEEWRDAIQALKHIITAIESGEDSPIRRCALVIQRENGELHVNGVGPMADDLAVVALLSLGLQQIQSEMLY